MPYGFSDGDLARIIDCLRQTEGLREAVLFGSRAKGTHRPGSDVDLALKGEGLSLREVFRLQDRVDDLWLPYAFDICLYESVESAALREHIDRVGKTVFQA